MEGKLTIQVHSCVQFNPRHVIGQEYTNSSALQQSLVQTVWQQNPADLLEKE